MAVFQWSGEEYVRAFSVMASINGVIGALFSLAYISGKLNSRVLPERRAIVISMILIWGYFILTYPYPFYSERMSYETLGVDGELGSVHQHDVI